MPISFRYDWSVLDLFRNVFGYAFIPTLITLFLGSADVLMPGLFGPPALDILKGFMSVKLMGFIALIGLLTIGLSLGASQYSLWYRFCKVINEKTMELSFSLISAMLGVGAGFLAIVSFTEYSGSAGTVAAAIVLLAAYLMIQFALGKFVFGEKPYWHIAMNGAPAILPRITALLLSAILFVMLVDTIGLQ